jgi:hypothetical protein
MAVPQNFAVPPFWFFYPLWGRLWVAKNATLQTNINLSRVDNFERAGGTFGISRLLYNAP